MGGDGSGRRPGTKDTKKRKSRGPASEEQKRKKRDTEAKRKAQELERAGICIMAAMAGGRRASPRTSRDPPLETPRRRTREMGAKKKAKERERQNADAARLERILRREEERPAATEEEQPTVVEEQRAEIEQQQASAAEEHAAAAEEQSTAEENQPAAPEQQHPAEERNPAQEEKEEEIVFEPLNTDVIEFDEKYAHESVMKRFGLKLVERLKEECRKQQQTVKGIVRPVLLDKDKWLLHFLRDNDFWIRTCHVPHLYEKLFDHDWDDDDRFCYEDVRVWLPDVEHEGVKVPCAHCGRADKSRRHSFAASHPIRRVVGLGSVYWIMSAEYKCTACKGPLFMASKPESVRHLDEHIRSKFPAVLSHRGGRDKLSSDTTTTAQLENDDVDNVLYPFSDNDIDLPLNDDEDVTVVAGSLNNDEAVETPPPEHASTQPPTDTAAGSSQSPPKRARRKRSPRKCKKCERTGVWCPGAGGGPEKCLWFPTRTAAASSKEKAAEPQPPKLTRVQPPTAPRTNVAAVGPPPNFARMQPPHVMAPCMNFMPPPGFFMMPAMPFFFGPMNMPSVSASQVPPVRQAASNTLKRSARRCKVCDRTNVFCPGAHGEKCLWISTDTAAEPSKDEAVGLSQPDGTRKQPPTTIVPRTDPKTVGPSQPDGTHKQTPCATAPPINTKTVGPSQPDGIRRQAPSATAPPINAKTVGPSQPDGTRKQAPSATAPPINAKTVGPSPPDRTLKQPPSAIEPPLNAKTVGLSQPDGTRKKPPETVPRTNTKAVGPSPPDRTLKQSPSAIEPPLNAKTVGPSQPDGTRKKPPETVPRMNTKAVGPSQPDRSRKQPPPTAIVPRTNVAAVGPSLSKRSRMQPHTATTPRMKTKAVGPSPLKYARMQPPTPIAPRMNPMLSPGFSFLPPMPFFFGTANTTGFSATQSPAIGKPKNTRKRAPKKCSKCQRNIVYCPGAKGGRAMCLWMEETNC